MSINLDLRDPPSGTAPTNGRNGKLTSRAHSARRRQECAELAHVVVDAVVGGASRTTRHDGQFTLSSFRFSDSVDQPDSVEPPSSLAAKEQQLAGYLEGLSYRSREVFDLFFRVGLNVSEIERVLKVSPDESRDLFGEAGRVLGVPFERFVEVPEPLAEESPEALLGEGDSTGGLDPSNSAEPKEREAQEIEPADSIDAEKLSEPESVPTEESKLFAITPYRNGNGMYTFPSFLGGRAVESLGGANWNAIHLFQKESMPLRFYRGNALHLDLGQDPQASMQVPNSAVSDEQGADSSVEEASIPDWFIEALDAIDEFKEGFRGERELLEALEPERLKRVAVFIESLRKGLRAGEKPTGFELSEEAESRIGEGIKCLEQFRDAVSGSSEFTRFIRDSVSMELEMLMFKVQREIPRQESVDTLLKALRAISELEAEAMGTIY